MYITEVKEADLARLALCAEIAVAGCELADDTIESSITLIGRAPTVLNSGLKVHHTQLQNVDQVRLVDSLEMRVSLQLGEVACADVIDALHQQLVQAVRLRCH